MDYLFFNPRFQPDYDEPCKCGRVPKFFCEVFSIRPISACLKPKTAEDFEEEAKNKK